jgi:hypothetical protein
MQEKPKSGLSEKQSDLEGLSLLDEGGEEVAMNLARVALRIIPVEDLKDPRYSRTSDGSVQVLVDHETFLALNPA